MKRIYVCSPADGNRRENIERAICYALYLLRECGTVPIVPHLYALILNENDPKERKLGQAVSFELLWNADGICQFGETATKEMSVAIQRAGSLSLNHQIINDTDSEKIWRKYIGEVKNLSKNYSLSDTQPDHHGLV